MKKYSILLTIILIFSGCTVSPPKEIVYEIPDFPVFIQQEEFWNTVASLDTTARPTESDYVNSDNTRIILHDFPLFGTKAKRVVFNFSHSNFLTGIRAQFDKSENESLKKHLLSLYGESVKTHKKTNITHFSSHSNMNPPILFDKNEVMEGIRYVWHAEKPISQSWTKDETEFFRQTHRDRFTKAGRNPITDEKEWQIYFENTWDRTIIASFASEEKDYDTEIFIEAIPKDPSMWLPKE